MVDGAAVVVDCRVDAVVLGDEPEPDDVFAGTEVVVVTGRVDTALCPAGAEVVVVEAPATATALVTVDAGATVEDDCG